MDNGLSQAADRLSKLVGRVLILIVMDNGLSLRDERLFGGGTPVLILIVMDNGLSREIKLLSVEVAGLNPYCNG